MIKELKLLYFIIRFFIELLQNRQSNVSDDKNSSIMKSQDTDKTLPLVPQLINNYGFLVQNLAKRHKRAPMFPVGFPFPGPGDGFPHPKYPGEYAYPPGFGYGYRPYPPTYEDYMLEHKRRMKAMERYQGMGYLDNNKVMQMITTVVGDFLGASALGQSYGSKPLDPTMTRPVRWLSNKIRGAAWTTTEEPKWRPAQWAPPYWRRRR